VSEASATKTLDFYSKTKHLVDSSMLATFSEIRQSKLKDIIQAAVTDEYKVFQTHSDGGGELQFAKKVGSETIGAFIQKVAAKFGMFVSCDINGDVVLQMAVNSGKPVARIYYSQPPVSEWALTFDDTKIFAEYMAYHTNDDDRIVTEKKSYNDCPRAIRRLVFEGKDLIAGKITKIIDFTRAKLVFDTYSFPIAVNTLRDDNGKLWRENTLVTITAPLMDIPDETLFLIRQVEFIITPDSAMTVLTLVPPFKVTDGELEWISGI
jgi:prophage tail gpP-like protein